MLVRGGGQTVRRQDARPKIIPALAMRSMSGVWATVCAGIPVLSSTYPLLAIPVRGLAEKV
jgi:hypothetical protein